MMLYINGQDIARFVVGVADAETVLSLEVMEGARPEQFLASIDSFLRENDYAIEDMTRLVVVVGPGSATALRAVLSIVNTIAFVRGVDLVGVEKDPVQDDEVFLRSILAKEIEVHVSESFLHPVYAHEPRITVSKKDHLRR